MFKFYVYNFFEHDFVGPAYREYEEAQQFVLKNGDFKTYGIFLLLRPY